MVTCKHCGAMVKANEITRSPYVDLGCIRCYSLASIAANGLPTATVANARIEARTVAGS